eukprot:TRINITY_DN225_c0_g1_i1.p1 TRINITY_DN225_c0_g1~~TRINITY_DN225_c0_g1_i1.p1  ORF type:complete len:1096 (-),score=260.74 TRINITY_DN225_c0_g1_i1:411-3698(-)
MSAEQHNFEIVLTNLMSIDNALRGSAEQTYVNARQNEPDKVVQALLLVGRSSANIDLRPFALILLRRALAGSINDKSIWDKISEQTQAALKQQLLIAIESEENPSVRAQLCEVTMDLAGDLLQADTRSWPEILEWLLRMASSSMWYHRQSALFILAHLSPNLTQVFGDQFHIIKNLLAAGLTDPQDIKVRLAALDASTNYIHTFTKQPARSELQTLLPAMLEVVANCLNVNDEENAQNALKLFIELAELDPGFIKPNAPMVIDAMIKIGQVKTLQDSTRQLAIEFLVTFVENKPTFSRSIPGFIPNLLNILLHMMLEMEDITLESWNAQDENDDALDILNSVVAQENLDRVCLSLNGESIVPDIFSPITQLIQNTQDWKCRHVALMALSMIGEGCYSFIAPALDNVINMVLPMFEDEHPRVRWAAANAAGQMSTDFGPKFQRKYHAQIIPRFIKLMTDTANPKVQAHTAAAIINFCEKFDAETIAPYLDSLLSCLLVLIQGGNKMVQEQALTAVASIAGCSEKHFIKYYDTFVPILKTILNTATTKDLRTMRGKAMECISLIGIAVGKEKFMADAITVMETLVNIQNSPLDADDPQREFILQAWTRISNCLGEDFIPYLKYVMPPLLKSAAINAGVRIHEIDVPEDEEEPGWEYIDVGEAKIAIHTSALDEKAQACNSIYCYASEMKAGFFPFVEECSKLLVPLMQFNYHDGVRLASLSSMSCLLECTKKHLEKNNIEDRSLLNNLFAFIYPAVIEAVKTETDSEVLVVGVEAIHECISVMGDNCLNPDGLRELLSLVRLLIEGTQTRRTKMLKNPDGDVDDSYLTKEELLKEDDINSEVAEVIGTLIKYHKTTFMSVATDLMNMIVSMIQPHNCPSDRQLAICVFDDLVDYIPEQSYSFFNNFVILMLQYATDSHPGVRQAACYGLGACAKNGGTLFKPMVLQTLDVLLKVITAHGSRDDEKTAPPTENAISSIGKIIQYQSDVVSDKLPMLVDAWVSWLPIEVDVIEAKVVHQQLCEFIKNMNALVFGPNGKNLPLILNIFGRIVDTELVNGETTILIKEILTQMSKQLPPEMVSQAILSIPPESQHKLRNLK